MNESEKNVAQQTDEPVVADNTVDPAKPQPDAAVALCERERVQERREARRWWIKLVVQPFLLLAGVVITIVALGFAQRNGYLSTGDSVPAEVVKKVVQYICPMMCTPPQSEPGRCPVCGMELELATGSLIDQAARRLANIHTVAVTSAPTTRTIRAVGELSYDEGTLKMLSAYVDGRLDRLVADYTGVVVTKGDHLALVYSPRLYSSQVELLLAKKARDDSRSATIIRVIESNRNLYESARQRLIELGMTSPQIEQLERTGKANSRMVLVAPISGTVIEKFAVEGQYMKEGQAIYRLADLSTVWLMLKLFPEDAATIRDGQMVEATVQSFPGQKFSGRVAFVDPNVDPNTRTVGVRVVIPNGDGLLRVGDYTKATIEVPLSGGGALAVPRDAVLMAADNSVVYVEVEDGRFELRNVVLGPSSGDQIVILSGVFKGEQVATKGNFLIDSHMQISRLPSLIDPTKAKPKLDGPMTDEMIAALAKLSPKDREIAESQRICPVTMAPLGSMGTPQKVDVNGTPVFICCKSCRGKLLDDPEEYLARLAAVAATNDKAESTPPMDLPPIGAPQAVEPQGDPPPIETPQPIRDRATENQQGPDDSTKRVSRQLREVVR